MQAANQAPTERDLDHAAAEPASQATADPTAQQQPSASAPANLQQMYSPWYATPMAGLIFVCVLVTTIYLAQLLASRTAGRPGWFGPPCSVLW